MTTSSSSNKRNSQASPKRTASRKTKQSSERCKAAVTSDSSFYFTNYSTEHFENLRKQKEERFVAAKKPAPVYTDEVLLQDEDFNTAEKLEFARKQLDYFLNKCTEFLHNLIQPGFAKINDKVFIGQCPWKILDHWFHYVCGANRKQIVRSITLDGERYPSRRFYYSWPKGSLPELNGDKSWFVRRHGNGNGNFSGIVESYIQGITFTVCENTHRVWASYEQCTVSVVGEHRFVTA